VALMALALIGQAALAQGGGTLHATATLINQEGSEVGTAKLVQDATGVVHLTVHARGLTPGLHGIHIHAVGRCNPADGFTSAGGHFNPSGAQHGVDNPDGPHAGDLPNMSVNPAGIGSLSVKADQVTLSDGPASLFDADGSAIVIHAGPDDYVTNPAGNSGARVACGVISRGDQGQRQITRSPAANKALVERYYREIANAELGRALAAADRLLTSDFAFYPPNDTVGMHGRDAHKGFLAWHRSVTPDEHWAVQELIAEDNAVVSRFTFSGTQLGEFLGIPPSGRSFVLHGVDIFRVKDGRISELRRYFDVLSMLQQIGALP
jgi:superoxide dismutase, Cu-Zn family